MLIPRRISSFEVWPSSCPTASPSTLPALGPVAVPVAEEGCPALAACSCRRQPGLVHVAADAPPDSVRACIRGLRWRLRDRRLALAVARGSSATDGMGAARSCRVADRSRHHRLGWLARLNRTRNAGSGHAPGNPKKCERNAGPASPGSLPHSDLRQPPRLDQVYQDVPFISLSGPPGSRLPRSAPHRRRSRPLGSGR